MSLGCFAGGGGRRVALCSLSLDYDEQLLRVRYTMLNTNEKLVYTTCLAGAPRKKKAQNPLIAQLGMNLLLADLRACVGLQARSIPFPTETRHRGHAGTLPCSCKLVGQI